MPIQDKMAVQEINDWKKQHAKNRAHERYDIKLNRHSYKALVEKIQKRDGIRIAQRSLIKDLWLITHEGVPMYAVYNYERKLIETFLPQKDCEEKYGRTTA